MGVMVVWCDINYLDTRILRCITANIKPHNRECIFICSPRLLTCVGVFPGCLFYTLLTKKLCLEIRFENLDPSLTDII